MYKIVIHQIPLLLRAILPIQLLMQRQLPAIFLDFLHLLKHQS